MEDRGLIGWDRRGNRYDAHPIVRGVVWQLTTTADKRAVYTALEAHFEPMATPEWQQVETLADLTPAIERYHTLVGLGRYDDAFVLFRDRLSNATLYRLAAHRERIAWLERLFPDGVAGLPALTREYDHGNARTMLAQSYQLSGKPGRSVPLFRQAYEMSERLGDALNRQIDLSNLGFALREIGGLREAVGALQQALLLSPEVKNETQEAIALQNLGEVLGSTSAHALGQVALESSLRLFTEQSARQSEGVVSADLAVLALWVGDLDKAGNWAERAWVLAAVQRVERDFIRAALLQGCVALAAGDLSRADECLHHALTRTRAVNVVECELPALIAVAELELLRGDPVKARASLDDVWEIAQRGPYPLHQVDAFSVLAAIASAEGINRARLPPPPTPLRPLGATARPTPITGACRKRKRTSRPSVRPSRCCRRSTRANTSLCPRSRLTPKTNIGSTRTAWTSAMSLNSSDFLETCVILGGLSDHDYTIIPSHRRRPVPMAGMGPGLRREDKQQLPRPSLGYIA
jgi:tetratricopeptide (TPR) repeat protein